MNPICHSRRANAFVLVLLFAFPFVLFHFQIVCVCFNFAICLVDRKYCERDTNSCELWSVNESTLNVAARAHLRQQKSKWVSGSKRLWNETETSRNLFPFLLSACNLLLCACSTILYEPTPSGRRNEIVIGKQFGFFRSIHALAHLLLIMMMAHSRTCGCQSALHRAKLIRAKHCKFYGKTVDRILRSVNGFSVGSFCFIFFEQLRLRR